MSAAARIAGAPISWGVCEVPGWGYQLTPDVVLQQMADLGIVATEFGPDGFLPAEPREASRVLQERGLKAVGGFVPVVLFDRSVDPTADVQLALQQFVEAGATMLVLAAASGADGYDSRPVLDDDQWSVLLGNLDRLADLAAACGMTATLHPHVGTMVEQQHEIERVLTGSKIGLTLDTGHLLIGGMDPLELARSATGRILHTHLKDVRADIADQVRSGRITYTDGVKAGMYRPLGQGDVDIAGIIEVLEAASYPGWYVMEQDAILAGPPTDAAGPIDDVRASYEFLIKVAG